MFRRRFLMAVVAAVAALVAPATSQATFTVTFSTTAAGSVTVTDQVALASDTQTR